MIKERNALQQAQLLAWFPDLLCDFPHNEHLNLAPFPKGTSSLPVPLVAASFAPPPLRLGAILPDVSMLLTVEALDLAAHLVHEDRHLCWSSTSWCQGHGLGGILSIRDDGWGEHAPHLHLNSVVQTSPLDAVHAIDQVTLDNEILLLGVRYSLPGLLENISQGLLDFGFAPIPVYLGNHSWVPQVHYRLVNHELLRTIPPEFLPHGGVHAAVVVGLSSNVDGDGPLRVCFAVTSSDKEILRAIPNILGHDHRLLFVPLPVLWVGDIDGVVMATFRVVDNKADRCIVSIVSLVCDPVVVDGTECDAECVVIVRERLGADGELGRCGCFGGSVVWG